jgi:hypothetical protein
LQDGFDACVCSELEPENPSLVPVIVTSRHSGKMASVLCSCCGDVLSFQKSCSDRGCKICSSRRRNRLISAYGPEISKMANPAFLMLSYGRQKLSRKLLIQLRRDFNKLRHRKFWKALGGFYVIELGTLDSAGCCNVHLHCVIDSAFVSQSVYSREWSAITGFPIVYIQRIRSFRWGILYVTKYVTKQAEGELSISDSNLINSVLRGSRLLQPFGSVGQHGERHSVCRNCGAIDSYISVEHELAIRDWVLASAKVDFIRNRDVPLAEAIESFDWWCFEDDS